MIIHDVEQGSLEWLALRAGIPTASEFDALLSPKTWKVKEGEGPQSYLAEKVAAHWIGGAIPGRSSFDMEQGHILEAEAMPFLELELEMPIRAVGFITTDDGRIGCSPDGLIGDTGVEVKCPLPHTHVKYLLKGTVPDDYLPQVHGSMYVTGYSSWRFLSYSRGYPALLLTVERDEHIQAQIHVALTAFLERFDVALEKMAKLNGGPSMRRPMKAKVKAQTGNWSDIIP